MSKTTTDPDGTGTDDDSTSLAEVLINELSHATALLEVLEDEDLRDMTDEQLVNVRTELKELEDTAEDVRKEQADDVLEDRVDPGEKLLGLHRVQSHRKLLKEDDATVIMRAVQQGVDYTDFVQVNASTLAEQAPELAEIGQADYTYFR